MSDAPARILIFSSSYPPVVGGLQNVAHNLAKQLLGRNYAVRVVTNRYPVDLPPREKLDGVLVDRVLMLPPSIAYLRNRRPDLFLASLYYGPKLLWRLRNLFREFQPQVVNVHFPDHQIDAVLKLRRQFDFKLVVSLHGDDVERFTTPVGTNGARGNVDRLRAILNAADVVTAVSRDLLAKAIDVEPTIASKSHVIHNGIDHTRFAEHSRHTHPRPYLLGIGRLVHKKGFDLLIDAFARCKAQHLTDLIIAGTGEERDALEHQVKQLQLNQRVHFFGQATPEEVVKLMNGSLGVVVPSRHEPFGIVALEALAAGKPVVATNVDGLAEFLEPFAGQATGRSNERRDKGPRVTLVPPSVPGIVQGLTTLSNGTLTSDGDAFRLPNVFGWPSVARAYEEVLLSPSRKLWL